MELVLYLEQALFHFTSWAQQLIPLIYIGSEG